LWDCEERKKLGLIASVARWEIVIFEGEKGRIPQANRQAKALEPSEVPVIHALFHANLFRPGLSTLILGIIQAVM
jgi:hypothetical protein